MIPITKSVIAPSSQLFKSISDFSFGFRLFLLLICISPPYVYTISYGAPYVKSFIYFAIFFNGTQNAPHSCGASHVSIGKKSNKEILCAEKS